ncbi:NAD(P)H-binding protein, partial [Streptomyces sp. NPDC059556]|uniref:NAD(P)H-binding protein n=1 Tax=Streptomyces sp. NPDC059556 TaxID=3346863 RepID=UPI003697D519
METGLTVAVFGAYGHTGRFVVAELLARGFVPVAVGRDAEKLRALAESRPGLDVRLAAADDPASRQPPHPVPGAHLNNPRAKAQNSPPQR